MDDFDEFFFEHYARVVGRCDSRAAVLGDAEDAAQDAFAKAMLRWRSVSAMDRPATWVYVVAVRELRRVATRATVAARPNRSRRIDARSRRRGRRRPKSSSGRCALLRARQRLAVVLRFHADLTVPEVSRAMQCSEGTVKSTLHAALERLRVDLGDRGLEGAHDGS